MHICCKEHRGHFLFSRGLPTQSPSLFLYSTEPVDCVAVFARSLGDVLWTRADADAPVDGVVASFPAYQEDVWVDLSKWAGSQGGVQLWNTLFV